MIPPNGFCPCGCGEKTSPPINVKSIWHTKRPYWAWTCIGEGCARHGVEQRNQSGDALCPWCGHQRRFVGHFRATHKAQAGYRETVGGKKVLLPRRDSSKMFSGGVL